jgi:hypothetical protein
VRGVGRHQGPERADSAARRQAAEQCGNQVRIQLPVRLRHASPPRLEAFRRQRRMGRGPQTGHRRRRSRSCNWRGLAEREPNSPWAGLGRFPPSRDPLILLHTGRPGERRTHESVSLAVRLVRSITFLRPRARSIELERRYAGLWLSNQAPRPSPPFWGPQSHRSSGC